MRDLLEYLIDEFHERKLPKLVHRTAAFRRVPRKVNAVIGMRRAGKTWFCFQQMEELLAAGVSKDRILYVNFEDERLLPFATENFQHLLDAYYGKFPRSRDELCFLFLDEVQRIAGWESFVRRVSESEPLQVCVTGSSSKVLSSEIATSLRGRSLTTEIFPFAFPEFLSVHGIESPAGRYGPKARAVLQNLATKYIECGGFPEVHAIDADLRREILRGYVDVVILRDVVERHAIGNVPALRSLIRHLMSAPANRFSVNKFHNTLRSQGIACAKNDLYEFLDHVCDAFLVHVVPIHARSSRTRQVNPRKAYLVDTGLIRAMAHPSTDDRGALLENLVFLHLRRQGLRPEYYVTRGGAEVDFFIPSSRREARQLLQVCWSLTEAATRRREEAALAEAMREQGARNATIITWMDESTSSIPGVDVVPAWKWMLQPPFAD